MGAYEQALSKLDLALALYQSIRYIRQAVDCMRLQGYIFSKIDRLDLALAKYEQAINLLRDNNIVDPKLEADCRYRYGYVLYRAEKYTQAIDALSAAQNLYETIRVPEMAASCLKLKAHCYYDQEQYDLASVVFAQAREQFKTLRDDSTKGICAYYLGRCYYWQENYETSIPYFSEAMAALAPAGSHANMTIYADCLRFLATIHFAQEHYAQALQEYLRARSFFQTLGAWPEQAQCLMKIGNCYFKQQNYERAAAYFDSAAAAYRQIDSGENEAACAVNASHALFNLGQYREAASRYRLAAQIDSALALHAAEAKARQSLGDALTNLLHYDAANAEYLRAVSLYSQLDQRTDLAQCYKDMANNYFDQKFYHDALDHYNRALNYFPLTSETALSRAWCLYRKARSLHLLEQYSQALLSYEQAEASYRATGDFPKTGESLNYAGDCHLALRQYSQARQKYEAALAIFLEVKDQEKICSAYRRLGRYYQLLNHPAEALQNYQNALSACRQTDHPYNVALCLHNIAELHAERNDFDKAQVNYREAQKLYQQARDSSGVAGCNFGLGQLAFNRKNYPEAQNYLEAARNIYHHLSEHSNEAVCLRYLGSISFNREDFRRALAFYMQSDSLFRHLHDPENIANCQIKIAKTYLRFTPPEVEKAFARNREALNLYRSINHPAGVAEALMQIGDLYLLRFDFTSARAYFEEALAQYGTLPESVDKADCEIHLAKAEAGLGNDEEAMRWLDKAHEFLVRYNDKEALANYWDARATVLYAMLRYEEALKADSIAISGYRQTGQIDAEADCRIQIANIYYDLNQPDSAADYYHGALRLAKKSGNEALQATCLLLLGNVSYDKEQYPEAQQYYEQAWSSAQGRSDYILQASCRINLGNLKIKAQQIEAAEQDYRQALELSQQHNYPKGEAVSYGNLGGAYVDQARYEQALDYFNRAETICDRYHFKRELRLVYTNKGVVLEKLERFNEAINAYIAAIGIIDQIGTGLSREHLLRSFFRDYAELYNHLILLLYQQNRLSEVMFYAEKMKSPESLQILQESIAQTGNPALIAEFNEHAKRILEARRRLTQTGKMEQTANTELWSEATETIESSFAKILAAAAKYGINLEDIYRVGHFTKEKIAGDQAYVLYYPTSEVLLIVVITSEGHRGVAVKIAQKVLFEQIQAYRNEIKKAVDDGQQGRFPQEIIDWNDPYLAPLMQQAQVLYDKLIAPIEPQIANKKSITIVPSGTIYYLPLHALAKKTAGGDYVFVQERWCVSYLPAFRFGFSLPTTGPLLRDKVFVFANSEGDLPGAESAAEEILKYVPDAQVFIRDQATEERYKQLCQQYSVLILLNHSRLDPVNPQKTCIRLARSAREDGQLYLSEVQNHPCPTNLVILTACETAIGGNHTGAEIVNLASAFSLARAKSIIATLWPIPDVSTKELMLHFYRQFFEKQQSPLEALYQAQLSLMRDARFKHPLFWGAFTFIGDSR
ncbi:MAG: tetratricopeptide repeat protein [candidate division KSB1 bacterium]|nr:tetratricopeptide repeat protein [candidate division KSB1 bacterium]